MADTKHPLPGHDHPAAMSILYAPGATFTKTLHLQPDGTFEKTDADNRLGFKYLPAPFDVSTIEKLEEAIRELAPLREAFPVRAAIIENPPGPEPGLIYRRISHGDTSTNALIAVPKSWACIDIDATSYRAPEGWMEDPEAMILEAITFHLPEPFWDAGVVVQFSSSMSAHGGDFRAHLWFSLSRATTSEELLWWLDPQIKVGLIDPAPLRPNQQLYTATPIWMDANGIEIKDPLGEHRILRLDGPPVEVPKQIARPTPAHKPKREMSSAQRAEWDAKPLIEKLRPYLEQIGDHEGGLGLYNGLLMLTWHYARLTKYQPRGIEWLRDLARARVMTPGVVTRDVGYIEECLGPKFTRHYETACTKVDAEPDKVYGDVLSPEEVAEIARQDDERTIEAKPYDRGFLTREFRRIAFDKPRVVAERERRQASLDKQKRARAEQENRPIDRAALAREAQARWDERLRRAQVASRKPRRSRAEDVLLWDLRSQALLEGYGDERDERMRELASRPGAGLSTNDVRLLGYWKKLKRHEAALSMYSAEEVAE